MITVDSINFKGKKALVRVDFNVPLDNLHTGMTEVKIVSTFGQTEI
jgi:3-phosphoglycerate kinase